MAQEAAEKARTEKVDVNKASRDDLITVPGFGPAAADAILKYREEHGRFRSVDDLVNVPGVGEATLGQARERLSVSGGRGAASDDNGAARRAGGERQHGSERQQERQHGSERQQERQQERQHGSERQHGGERQSDERQATESARRTGAAAAEATQRTGEQIARGAEETVRQTANVARETTERGAEMARRGAELARQTGEAAGEGYGELFTLGRDGVEGMARASRAMLHGASELNGVWMSFWNEQLSQGMETMRALAECRSWHEALELQNEFTRASLERMARRATKSAELTADIIAGSLRPVQEQGRRTLRRVS